MCLGGIFDYAEKQERLTEVEAELAEKQEAAEASIRAAKDKAFAEVRGIAASATAAAVEALAGVEVSDKDAEKAVDGAMKGA